MRFLTFVIWAALSLCMATAWVPMTALSAAEADRLEMVRSAHRILFLGDSITFAGDYIAHFEAWLLVKLGREAPLVIDAGLPSETVSGLSEQGHAGGKFPRPDLAERLDRVLALVKPELVFACYGINCGIYQPFDEQRFAAYQAGIKQLKYKVEAAGARLVLITPPSFDDHRAKREFSYNAVLDRYAAWLVQQRDAGWTVIDLHGPMTAELERRRRQNPDFTFQPDAVHPNAEGHQFIARELMRWFGDPAAAEAASAEILLAQNQRDAAEWPIIRHRLQILRDAYVGAAGHLRPGIAQGVSVAEADRQATELTASLQR
jgi:lysophospholipase L1-like esterase